MSDLLAGEQGVFLKSNGVKLDFLSWNIPFIREAVIYDKIQMAHVEEIAAMKLFAITRRGEKKDYYDIAFLLRQYTLTQLLQFYHERHPKNDVSLVARFLTGFSDINFQPEPPLMTDFSWEDAKALLQTSVKEYFQAK